MRSKWAVFSGREKRIVFWSCKYLLWNFKTQHIHICHSGIWVFDILQSLSYCVYNYLPLIPCKVLFYHSLFCMCETLSFVVYWLGLFVILVVPKYMRSVFTVFIYICVLCRICSFFLLLLY